MNATKLDVLAFAPHPDDIELWCGGTVCKMAAEGKKVGIIDMTRGEMGTRGTPEIREVEAAAASKVMGVIARENLGFRDGHFVQDEAHIREIIRMVRKYQPDLILAPAREDRHPDHGRASKLVRDAVWYSGLAKMETEEAGQPQQAWRPKKLFYYIQDHHLPPDFVVDISSYFEQKQAAVRAFGTQFFNPEEGGKQTYISSKGFWDFMEARARVIGHMAGFTFGEGFQSETPLAVNDPMDLVPLDIKT